MTTIRSSAKTLIIALLVGIIALGAGIAVAHTDGTEIRITAMRHDDGRIEFAVQEREGEGWGERILPRARFFPASGRDGRWLNSTPIIVGVVEAPFSGAGTFQGVVYATYATDPLTDAVTTVVTVDAQYVDDDGLDQEAELTIACVDGVDGQTLKVVLSTAEVHSADTAGGVSVTYRIDSQSAVTEQWFTSGDWEDVSPTGLGAARVIAALRGAQSLQVRTPETPELTFGVSNLFNTPAQVNIDNCGQ